MEHTAENSERTAKFSPNFVNFSVASVVSHLTCAICKGILKEPVTLAAKCAHSFCKSCLFSKFEDGERHCPTCNIYLEGVNPFLWAQPDRTLESLCDKVLLPFVKERDDEEEQTFYASRGVRRKADAESSRSTTALRTEEQAAPTPVKEADDELELLLIPSKEADSQHELPKMKSSHLKTSGRMKIFILKKVLLRMLDMPLDLVSSIELSCDGRPVGNELSLHFIERTMWMSTTEPLRLGYKLSHDHTPRLPSKRIRRADELTS